MEPRSIPLLPVILIVCTRRLASDQGISPSFRASIRSLVSPAHASAGYGLVVRLLASPSTVT